MSFRLVPGQDPKAIFAAFRRFVAERLPPGAQVSYQLSAWRPAWRSRPIRRGCGRHAPFLQEEYGRPAVMMGCGGSIPVVEQIKRTLGMESLLMGFGLEDDQIHSPNEKFEMRCFRQGTRSHVRPAGQARDD